MVGGQTWVPLECGRAHSNLPLVRGHRRSATRHLEHRRICVFMFVPFWDRLLMQAVFIHLMFFLHVSSCWLYFCECLCWCVNEHFAS